jgi:MFS family permease
LVLAAAFLGWMFDGFEMGIFPLVARPALQQMQSAQGGAMSDAYVGHWMGIATAAFLMGAAAGGVLFGWLGDRLGRVRAMSLSILFYSLFTGLIYFAHNPLQLTACRFAGALGMGGEWSLGVALVMEIWPERFRPLLAGLIGAASNFGFALIGLVGASFSVTQASWRWVALVGAAPALLTLLIQLFVPESQRWQQARSAASRPLREVLGPGLRRNTILAALFCGIALIGTWGSVQWIPLWADQLTQGTRPDAKGWVQMLTAVGAIVGSLAGALLGGKLGRRMTYFVLCLLSFAACAALFRGVGAYGPAFLALSCAVGATTAAFYGWAPLYLPELFPTRVRATGQGLAFNAGRIVAAIGALQTGALMSTFHGSYAQAGAVISMIYLLGLVVIWFAPETKGRPLPD